MPGYTTGLGVTGLRQRFRDVVTREEELRAVVGQPTERSVAKVVHVIDDHARRFIAHAPFVFVASAGAGGMVDVSPKGDPPGFVKVLDDRTLAIPDARATAASTPSATSWSIRTSA